MKELCEKGRIFFNFTYYAHRHLHPRNLQKFVSGFIKILGEESKGNLKIC